MIALDQLKHLPYGTQLQAGMYVSTVLADMDFETYSAAGYVWNETLRKWDSPEGFSSQKRGLGAVGAKVYSEHPTFEVLSLKYDLKDGRGVRFWRPGLPLPQDLFDHVASGKLIEAHNSGFECHVWRECERRYGWPAVPYDLFRCSMAKARAWSLPGALDAATEVMGTLAKDKEGKRLINMFSVPQKPTAKRPALRIMPEDEPEEFAKFVQYNEIDIVAEAHLSANTPDLSPIELEHWQYDQLINRRGVHIDIEAVRGGISILQQAHAKYGEEMRGLTGGIAPTEVAQLQGWCNALGARLQAMDEDALTAELKRDDLPASVHRVLTIRSLLSSASVKKLYSMLHQVDSRGRLTDLYKFHAARTGRPTGADVQPTNLPRSGPDVWRCFCGKWYGHTRPHCPWCLRQTNNRVNKDAEVLPANAKPLEWNPYAMKDAITVMRTGSLAAMEWFFGDALHTLAGCLRGMFDAAPKHKLVSSDWTAIEAVVLACLAGEQWRIDLFRAQGPLYETSGAMIGGVSVQELLDYAEQTGQKHQLRQVGKVSELALGFGGWVRAWLAMEDNCQRSEEEIKGHILAWRERSPAIVEFWGGQKRKVGFNQWRDEFYGVEGHFIQALLNPGQWFCFQGLYFHSPDGHTVYIRLLSGRYLTYHNVTLTNSTRWGKIYDIWYWGWNTNPKNGPSNKWIQMGTHGGKLTENIVQATANDFLRHTIPKLERDHFPIVLHIYDELVGEIPDAAVAPDTVARFERHMTNDENGPHWAVLPDGSRWPIGAKGGWVDTCYQKG